MQPNKTSAGDFFLNLGAIVALYTVAVSVLNLLFTVINSAYPQITNGYNYYGSQSISWPVAILIIFSPVYILLMWLMEKGYKAEPEKKHLAIRRWLTYITLFVAGLAMAVDLVTVLYYFIDGQELTIGFLLKVLSVLVVTICVFLYYISDIRDRLTSSLRKIWLAVAVVLILGSISWGFVVLGSPATQRLIKYDSAKVSDLQNLTSAVQNFYSVKGVLPKDLAELVAVNYINQLDAQTQKPYEYKKLTATTYEVCAEFNKASPDATEPNIYARPLGYTSWTHSAGRDCFEQAISPDMYKKI